MPISTVWSNWPPWWNPRTRCAQPALRRGLPGNGGLGRNSPRPAHLDGPAARIESVTLSLAVVTVIPGKQSSGQKRRWSVVRFHTASPVSRSSRDTPQAFPHSPHVRWRSRRPGVSSLRGRKRFSGLVYAELPGVASKVASMMARFHAARLTCKPGSLARASAGVWPDVPDQGEAWHKCPKQIYLPLTPTL
jgi:hypothetical protein